MNNYTAGQNPDFFGKDGFVPFLGQVEDVNDPKRAGRVKVRCVGWHPKEKSQGEDSLKTEDLPWARVGMPATHPQQSRIGGKHGLLPGSWVMGFFLDGQEANKPFVLTTFNFTPKSSDEDMRSATKGQDGKLTEEDKAYDKIEVSPKTQPNIATRTPGEEGSKGYKNQSDPSGDVPADESIDECSGGPSRESVAATRRMKQEMKKGDKGNVESQIYEVGIADGLCGTIAHAREDIQKKVKEQVPSQQSRFIYNDAVWNTYTGSFLDMNGIFAQLAMEVSNTMKQPLQSIKSQTEEAQRLLKGTTLLAAFDRDGLIRQATDLTTSKVSDMIHGMFGSSMIDALFGLTNQMLKNINNSDEQSSNDQNQQEVSASPTTQMRNNEAICITDTFLDNLLTLTDASLTFLTESSTEAVDEQESSGDSSAANSNSSGLINSLLGGMQPVMLFPLTQKYSVFASIFNKSGPLSQDILTKSQGCGMSRQYKTTMGTMLSSMGFSGGGSGSSSGSSGGGSRKSPNGSGYVDLTTVGFGGYPGAGSGSTNTVLCEDATIETVPDPVYDNNGVTSGTSDHNTNTSATTGTSTTGTNVDPATGIETNTTSGGVGQSNGPEDIFQGGNPNSPNFGGIGQGPQLGSSPVPDDQSNNESVDNLTGQVTTVSEVQPTGTTTLNEYGSITSTTGFSRVSIPRGLGAVVIALGLPSANKEAALNFVQGKPNQLIVLDPGRFYFYNNPQFSDRIFPSIYIPGYDDAPTPVVDRRTGEFVAILSEPLVWGENPQPTVTLIPDDSPVGIVSDDPNYSIRLGGFFIANTGFAYTNPTVTIRDKDNGTNNSAKVNPIVVDGRIVEIEIVNSGAGFLRIPEVIITDESGYNAKVYPIMKVVEIVPGDDIVVPVESIQCPSKNYQNLL
jgi:hypothetical protein